jgi:hypothetical protein
MEPEIDINGFITKIHELNAIINKNGEYINKIAGSPNNKKLHNKNFLLFKTMMNEYNSNFDYFRTHIKENNYLFKCFYDIFIKYLVNIAGFIHYVQIYDEYLKEKFNLRVYYEDMTETNTCYDYNLNELLKILKLSLNYPYKIELYDLNEKNIDFEDTDYIPTFNYNELKKNANQLINYLKKLLNDTIYNLLLLYETQIKPTENNYITIPQYTSICWFISILTGMCYSDANKKLITSKIDIDNIKEDDDEFTLVIKTIIKNITRVYRTYDMEKLTSETNCEMYEYLKTKPKFVLDNLLYDMCIFFVDDYNRYKFNKRISRSVKSYKLLRSTIKIKLDRRKKILEIDEAEYDNFISFLTQKYKLSKYAFFFNVFFDNIIKKANKYILDIFNLQDYGLKITDVNILEYLYELLGIKSKFIYVNKNDIKKDELLFYEYNNKYLINANETPDDIPDIIVLEYNNSIILDLDYSTYINPIKYNIKIINNNLGIIEYKGVNYKLDYILHGDNAEKNRELNYDCGHFISAITYDNKDYIYDSSKISQYLNCGDKLYKLPCTLMRQDWNKDINKDLTYCIENCKYNLECNIDNIPKDERCYTFNTDIVYVYVRIKK